MSSTPASTTRRSRFPRSGTYTLLVEGYLQRQWARRRSPSTSTRPTHPPRLPLDAGHGGRRHDRHARRPGRLLLHARQLRGSTPGCIWMSQNSNTNLQLYASPAQAERWSQQPGTSTRTTPTLYFNPLKLTPGRPTRSASPAAARPPARMPSTSSTWPAPRRSHRAPPSATP